MLLSVSGIKKSTYHYQRSKVGKDDKNKGVMHQIKEIYHAHQGRYGYRRITLELRNRGVHVNHKKVKRLMSVMSLYGIKAKSKYKSYKGDQNGSVKNLLLRKVVDEAKHKTYYERCFETQRCDEKWATDVSEFHIAAGKLYLSPIIDLHHREIIAYTISKSPNFKQTQEMLQSAFKQKRELKGLLLYSDQGWQYQMQAYHQLLKEKGILQSMSRKGNCLDNSPMENFFGKMKMEMFYGHEYEFKSLEALELAMRDYLFYYNHERITTKLKGLTPVQYRNQSLAITH